MAAVSGQRLVVGLGDVLLLTLVIDPSMMDTNDNRETLRVNTSRLALISSLTVTTRRPHGFQSCRGKSVGWGERMMMWGTGREEGSLSWLVQRWGVHGMPWAMIFLKGWRNLWVCYVNEVRRQTTVWEKNKALFFLWAIVCPFPSVSMGFCGGQLLSPFTYGLFGGKGGMFEDRKL